MVKNERNHTSNFPRTFMASTVDTLALLQPTLPHKYLTNNTNFLLKGYHYVHLNHSLTKVYKENANITYPSEWTNMQFQV